MKNEGNVSVKDGTLEDDHADLSGETFALAPGEEATFTYTYEVTQDDVDAGEIVNVVKANATAERGDDPEEVEATATVTAEEAAAELSITKEADPTSGVAVGDTITYTVVVKNEGNVSVKDGTLEDDHADLSSKTFALAPGEEATFTYTYTVTQADVDAGSIVNVVKANATAARGNNPAEVSATATVTAEEAAAELSITKSANPTEVDEAGTEITYTVVVKNEGNVTVKSGKLVDDHVDLSSKTFELAPGASETFTYTYEVTQADMDAGSIVNIVKANATAARGENPAEVNATATVTVNQNGHVKVVKETTSTAPEGGYKLGDTVSYKITAKNDGNLTITDITVTDERTGLSEKIASLAPGAEQVFTTETTVTEADILSGHIINDATATGTSPDPDKPDVPVDPGHTDDDPEDKNGHLTVVKETTSTAPEGGYKLGDTVSYKITAKNDGNLTITDITVTDERTGLSEKIASLAPGAEQVFTTETTVTEADILSGHIINDATATGTSPDPDKPDVPVDPGHTDDDPEDKNGHLTVVKETTSTAPEGGYKLGDTVSYKITAKNDGNLTITDITVTDERTGLSEKIASLAPGAEQVFTTETTVTEADILSGHIINDATATGTSPDPDKPDVPVDPGHTDDDPEDPKPAIVFTKTANKASYQPGETVTYTFTVKNTGNLTINDLSLVDNLAGIKLGALNKTSIAPGETATATATYVVTLANVEADRIVNTATVNGKDSRGESISGTDTVTVAATASYTINYVFTWPGGAAPAGAPATPGSVTVARGDDYVVGRNSANYRADYDDIPYGIAPNGNVITVLRFQGWDTGNIADVTSNRTVHGAWTIQMVWYTVTYTDGVPGQVIFPDQVTTTLRIGANTPAFNGTPTREGFNFTGWAPAVSPTVTGNNVYTAQWAPIEEEEERIVEPTPEPTPVVEEEIVDEEVPQAAPAAAWALINLLAALGTVATAVGMIITFFKKKDDDDDGTKANPDEESDENKGKKSKFLGLIPAVASVIIFILTENMHNPMTLVDKWTIPMVLILAANGIVAYLTRNKKPEDEDTEKAAG